MFKNKREINKDLLAKKYADIYHDVQKGMSFEKVGIKYGYKNTHTARTIYYLYILPIYRGL